MERNWPAMVGELRSKVWRPASGVAMDRLLRDWSDAAMTLEPLPEMLRARLAEAATAPEAAEPALEPRMTVPALTLRAAPTGWDWVPEIFRVPGPVLDTLPEKA